MRTIKRSGVLLVTILTLVVMSGCSMDNTLLILNWGEYINDEVVEAFEEKCGCRVIINIADSNELFYSKIKSGTTAYDLVLPSDYMIEKMASKDLLQKIDYTKLTNYDPINNPYMAGILGIQSEMFEGNEDYAVPYFWGTFGLMYNKRKAGLEEAIKTGGWQAYFNQGLLPAGTRVGIYNVPRFAYAAAMLYNDLSPNEASTELISLAYDTLSLRKFDEWGTDTLKKGIVADNLDLAFVYTGDFLDMLYTRLDAGDSLEEMNFDIYIPDDTIAFMDGFVIPKKARHVDLAHQFIDYFLDPENAYLNASVVGYATPLQNAYNMITEYEGEDEWLTAWAYANKFYYPEPDPDDLVQFKGVPLKNFDQSILDKINTMVNNVKVRY